MDHKVYVRGSATRIAGTDRFRYLCPVCKHTAIRRVNKGKLGRRHPVGETGLALFARWWRKDAGGVTFDCPTCTKRSQLRRT